MFATPQPRGFEEEMDLRVGDLSRSWETQLLLQVHHAKKIGVLLVQTG
jgi:hypothetical protein